jgi:hypothetical protein
MKDNSEGNFLNVKLVGEDGDLPCHPTKSNTIIKTKLNGFQVGYNAIWDEWEFAIVFPDHEKAKFFVENFNANMYDYREGMLRDDYYVHIIHFKYPIEDALYADQIRVSKEESKFSAARQVVEAAMDAASKDVIIPNVIRELDKKLDGLSETTSE